MKKIIFCSLLLILLWLGTAFSQKATLYPKPTIEALPEGVSIYQLDNGLQVLLIENPALPMVGVNVVVKAGSAYETFKTSGMSHCLEHLLFNGTTTRTQKQLYDETDLIGGYNNANTAEYYTNYMMVMPAEHARKGMELQADMLFNSIIPVEKFEKEKAIVLEEISKSLNDPSTQLNRNAISILYPKHALSLPTLGTYSTIEHMKRDEVYNFYKNNYVPNNMILSAIGNFNSAEMLEMINEIYGKVQPGEVKRNNNLQWATGFQPLKNNMIGAGEVHHRFYNGAKTKVQLLYRLPNINNPVFYKLLSDKLEDITAGIEKTVTGKFEEAIKKVGFSIRRNPLINFVEVEVVVFEKIDFKALERVISEQMKSLDFSFLPETITAEAAKGRTDFLRNIEKPHMFGIYNAHEFAVNGIEAVLASYGENQYYEAARRLERLKFYPEPIMIIQAPALSSNGNMENIALQTKLYVDPENGKNVIAVQNKASSLLAIHYLIKHKAMFEAKYGKDAAKILHDCVGQRLQSEENLKTSTKFGLNYKVNDLSFLPMDDIYLHRDFGYIRAEGLADDIPGVISFLNSRLKDFVPTKEEFEKALVKFSGSMDMLMFGGGNKAKKLFEKTYKSYVYTKPQYPAGDKNSSYENIMAFSEEYFQPGNMIISVVSPLAPGKIDSLFSGFLGEPIENESAVVETKLLLNDNLVSFDEKGGGKRAFLFWGFTKKITSKDKPALKALSLILSDQIVFDIRETRGMAYHLSAGIQTADDKALFYIKQGTRQKNVDVLLPLYPEFFKMKSLNDITEKDLEKSVNMYLGRMMFRRLSSINRAYYLAHSLYFHEDINYDHEFLEQLKKVTLNDVQQVAKKYMKVKNPVSVVVR